MKTFIYTPILLLDNISWGGTRMKSLTSIFLAMLIVFVILLGAYVAVFAVEGNQGYQQASSDFVESNRVQIAEIQIESNNDIDKLQQQISSLKGQLNQRGLVDLERYADEIDSEIRQLRSRSDSRMQDYIDDLEHDTKDLRKRLDEANRLLLLHSGAYY
jgi:HPt (histidine-containing phosphotransfer) domain-containing protein